MVCISTPSYSLSVNGSLCGFFKGKKGLRQGDPPSPLLFVIVMEYLTRILKKMSHKQDFEFHYSCGPLRLSHLAFAADLMLFCKGNIKSITLMMRALKAFSQAYGLEANKDKTAMYFGNVKDDIKQRILEIIGFSKGTFPSRYLGVPISAKRLSVAECDALVDRIIKRIMCWSSRHLSYAARNVLFKLSYLVSTHIGLRCSYFQRLCWTKLYKCVELFYGRGKLNFINLLLLSQIGFVSLRTREAWG